MKRRSREQYDLERLASKYRALAGEIMFVDLNKIRDTEAQKNLVEAHNSLCKVFHALEVIIQNMEASRGK